MKYIEVLYGYCALKLLVWSAGGCDALGYG
jgi:hypothetical protein